MEDKDRVKEAIDIVSYIQTNGIPLKKQSHLFVGLCPFHAEKHGSFTVYPETQSFHCFGCHMDGDVFTFAMKRNHWTFPEALDELARYANIQLTPINREKADKRERLYALLEAAAKIYHNYLFQHMGQAAEKYLFVKRELSIQTIIDVQMGYAPPHIREIIDPLLRLGYGQAEMVAAGLLSQNKDDKSTFYAMFRNRIMIPLRDHRGRIVGFVGRAMQDDQQPKYLTGLSTDVFQKSELIYRPTSRVKNGHSASFDTLVVVEGQMDAISALNRGFENVVASMGTSLSSDQIDLLCRGAVKKIVFCLDRDEAGRKALRSLTEKHVSRLASKGISLYAMFAPHGKDPDDTFREMPHLWQPAVDAARPVVFVLIDLEMAKLGDNPTAAKVSAMVNELLPILKSDNPLIEDENIKTLADKTGIAFERLKTWLTPQMRVMDKPTTAPKPESIGLPTTEEWVLHGILKHEADGWLARANACLLLVYQDPMPYALVPLNGSDFTDSRLRRFFEVSVKSQSEGQMIRASIDAPLEATYQRIAALGEIGAALDIPFSYDIFIHYVYELRLKRLRKERPAFEGKEASKSRECAIAIGCLHMAQEELIEST